METRTSNGATTPRKTSAPPVPTTTGKTRKISIPGLQEKSSLHGVMYTPRYKNASSTGIIITHPHPLLGGNMHNNVVSAIFKSLIQQFDNFTIVKFDFRGTSWRGKGEREDVESAVRHLLKSNIKSKQDPSKSKKITDIILIGYSYGSIISGSLVNEIPQVSKYISIAPPFGVSSVLFVGPLVTKMKDMSKPSLWILGDQDQFSGVDGFKNKLKELHGTEQNQVTSIVVPDCDHFWLGKEEILTSAINKWINVNVKNEEQTNM